MSALERLPLKTRTPIAWVAAVEADFDSFLVDHASCERKSIFDSDVFNFKIS